MKRNDMNLSDTQKKKALKLSSELTDAFDKEETGRFAEKHSHTLWYHNFKLLYDMITDKNFLLEKKSYLVIAGALTYVVLPVDIVPDFLLGVGFLDDSFVLGAVIKQLAEEIEKYKAYKNIA
jgi:uncharacterized membrane protein YkvA (DUF1232 family)